MAEKKEVHIIEGEVVHEPWVSEATVRGDLFTRDHEFTKVELMSRNPNSFEGEKKELAKEGRNLLVLLKRISKQLGFLEINLKAEPQDKRFKSGGNAEFLSLDGERKSNVDIAKLKNLVEEEGSMVTEDMKVKLEEECKGKNNSCLQSFLIYNYGETLHMVEPVAHVEVPYLRRHGLSEKEIELMMYIWFFHYGDYAELIPMIFPYIPDKWWKDIERFMMNVMSQEHHKENRKRLEKYLEVFVKNTFVTQIQEFEKTMDYVKMFGVEIEKGYIYDNGNIEYYGNDDGGTNDEGEDDRDNKKQRIE